MLFTSDSHLEKFSSMLPCRFYRLFTQWLREESVIPVTFSRNRLESGQKVSLEKTPPPLPPAVLRRTKRADVMVVCPGPYPWYQFLHSNVTIQSLSTCRYTKGHPFRFFSALCDFFRKLFNISKGFLQFFWSFATNWVFKKPKSSAS